MENGKTVTDASTLVLLAHALHKPLGYFYPHHLYKEIKQEELTAIENEPIINFRQIWEEHQKGVAVRQIHAPAEFYNEQMI